MFFDGPNKAQAAQLLVQCKQEWEDEQEAMRNSMEHAMHWQQSEDAYNNIVAEWHLKRFKHQQRVIRLNQVIHGDCFSREEAFQQQQEEPPAPMNTSPFRHPLMQRSHVPPFDNNRMTICQTAPSFSRKRNHEYDGSNSNTWEQQNQKRFHH